MRLRSSLLLIALSLPLVACPGPYTQQKMENDIDGLKKQMADIESKQKGGGGDARQQLADMGNQLEQIRTDISMLQGRVESLTDAASKKSDEQLKIRQDLEIRIAQLDESIHSLQTQVQTLQSGATAVPTATPVAMASATPLGKLPIPSGANVPPTPYPTATGLVMHTATPTPAASPTGKVTDQVIYQRAVEALDGKRYGDARTTFGELITKYPKSELADNSRYWIGESYYAEKDYASAILEFDKVIKDYPNGDKVPAAMLKQGLAFLEIGEKDGGVATLNDLIKKYPKSEEAKKAKERLAKVK